MSEMGQLAVIVASVRKDRIGPMVARWFLSRVQANTAAAVDAGGISGGLRAVEQLRMIFAELHVVTVQAAVSLPHVWDQFDEHGNLRQPERPGSAADTLLRQVAWWGRTLREAKAQRPYDG